MGEVLYEWNECARGAAAFTRGLHLLRGATERRGLLRAFLGLARSQWAIGEHTLAAETLAHCHAWFTDMGFGDDTYLLTHLAYTWARMGQLEQVERWSPYLAPTPVDELAAVQISLQAHTHLLRFQRGDDKNAAVFVDTIDRLITPRLAQAAQHGWVTEQIELLVLQAATHHMAQRSQTARAALAQALTLGRPAGYVRSFCDGGLPITALLQERSRDVQTSDERAYVRRLLTLCDQPATSAAPNDQGVVAGTHALSATLHEREVAVLRLIAAGRSNREIATTLVIALSTVKTHINNCYGKLGVHTRTQAVARARELGLI